MKLTISQIRQITLFTLFAVVFFGAGFFVGQERLKITTEGGRPKITISRELPPSKQSLDFSLFWDVWDRLHREYYQKEKLDPAKLIYGAIEGMVAAAGDPYTAFLPPAEQKRTTEDLRGSFDGIGIQIGFKGTQLTVISPLEDTPAQKAGIQTGDFILWIKDEKRAIDKGTVGISLPEAVDAIRGPGGTEVTLTLSRQGVEKPFEVKVRRAKIDVISVKVSFLEEGAVHLKLISFGAETSREWEKGMSEINLKCQPSSRAQVEGISPTTCKGIILDLRNNSGGFLNGAVFIASEFIKAGTVVIQERASGEQTKLSVDRRGRLLETPLVILVNKGSASASEIVAAALRDHNRAKIVGETTFGKGTIQDAQELTGGAGFHITTARWLTPDGVWVNDKGLEPDIKVEDKTETEKDEQLLRAVEEL